MRVHVIHAHPVEDSFSRALFTNAVDALQQAGHEVDACNLYADDFGAVMGRDERITYHDVPDNIPADVRPYVERLRATDALVFVHPVWNYGYPAILKGYFDRVFIPGVSFVLEGGDRPDRGRLVPSLKNIKKVAYVTHYGGDRLRTMLMGDPPRLLAHRWGWAMFGTRLPPTYLALYGIDTSTPKQREDFIAKVRRVMSRF